MNGLELCKNYYEKIGYPAFESKCPEIIDKAAFGLVGEGSECFGFDDEISRDHDWGPGFCIWLTPEDYEKYGETAQAVYNELPQEWMGFKRLLQSPMSSGRVGVFRTDMFYKKFIGIGRAPATVDEWRRAPESGLCAASNGMVWNDPLGIFSGIRQSILSYYPEDLRKKKIARHAALAAQSGQYNFYRVEKRNDEVAIYQTIAEFITHIQALVFLLNCRYMPYYKWTNKAMQQLPVLGSEISSLICDLCAGKNCSYSIERISILIIEELNKQGLSQCKDDYLMNQAMDIQAHIKDPRLKSMHVFME